MGEPDYYLILEVSMDADARTIQAAYHRLALRFHPDTHLPESSSTRMQAINQAYEVLSDPVKRREYDRRHFNITDKTDAPTQPSRPTPPPGPFEETLVYSSDFFNPDKKRWIDYKSDWAKTFHRKGYYYITLLKPRHERYAYPGYRVKNFCMSVNVQLVQFTLTTEIGFIYMAKIERDVEHYSRISIRPDGYSTLYHIAIKNAQIVKQKKMFDAHAQPNIVKCGKDDTNTLKLRVISGYVEFSVNGESVIVWDDGRSVTGLVGVILRNGISSEEIVARFRDFKLYTIDRV